MYEFENFIEDESRTWHYLAGGIARQIVAYDDQLMIVKVSFETGGIGVLHQHVHTQTTYIDRGVFEVTVEGKTKILRRGDVFFTRSLEWHGVKCMEAGLLIDVFHPYREDFV